LLTNVTLVNGGEYGMHEWIKLMQRFSYSVSYYSLHRYMYIFIYLKAV